VRFRQRNGQLSTPTLLFLCCSSSPFIVGTFSKDSSWLTLEMNVDDEALARELHRELNVGPRRQRQRRAPPPPPKREVHGKSTQCQACGCNHGILITRLISMQKGLIVLHTVLIQERGLMSLLRTGPRQRIAMISPRVCRRKLRRDCHNSSDRKPLIQQMHASQR
jgi:hypothetical protein